MIAINAHLLAPDSGYRRAGIHQYIYRLLTTLPLLDEALDYTVLLNHRMEETLPHLHQQIGLFNTDHPIKRILWEQCVQPFTVRRLKPDLYHGMAFVIPRGLGCPSIVTVYDLSFEYYPEVLSKSRRFYLRRFTRESCHRATRILAISESTARDMVNLWGIPREKIDVTLLGVSSEFRPILPEKIEAFREQKQLPKRFLFFLGTFEPRKNLPMLLRAYAQLPDKLREEVHLVLGGGKGWMYEEIFATIAQYQLQTSVHTPGYISADELVLWYNAAEALVYPTLYEGFGFPIIEAMACGKPVLASNTSSLPEAAGELGILLPPDDETAWAKAMQAVIEGQSLPETLRLLEWAGQFTWESTARRTLESYYRAIQ